MKSPPFDFEPVLSHPLLLQLISGLLFSYNANLQAAHLTTVLKSSHAGSMQHFVQTILDLLSDEL
jgi:hypothetical protein